MRRHPPHHLSPAKANHPAGQDPETRLTAPKPPQQRSDQARKPVISEQENCSYATACPEIGSTGSKFRSSRPCQPVRRMEKLPSVFQERPASGGLLRIGSWSPGSEFGNLRLRIADSQLEVLVAHVGHFFAFSRARSGAHASTLSLRWGIVF